MQKKFKNLLKDEHAQVAKCIFKGLSNIQIAKELNCSLSTVSNRLCVLFEKYNAKSRSDFILNVFGEIIGNYKIKIEKQTLKIIQLEQKCANLRRLLEKIAKTAANKEPLEFCLKEVNKFLCN